MIFLRLASSSIMCQRGLACLCPTSDPNARLRGGVTYLGINSSCGRARSLQVCDQGEGQAGDGRWRHGEEGRV